jgi:hypothetical protein
MSCVFDTRLGLQMNQIAAKKPEADTELDDQEMDSSLDRTPPGIQVIQADKYDSEPQKLAVADDDSGEGGGELSDYPNTDYCENEEDSDEDESINLDAANYGFDPLDKYLLRKNKSSSPPNGTAKPIDMDYGNTKPEPRDATDRLIVRPKQEVWERRRGRILMEGFVEEPISNELDPFSEGTDSPKCFSRTKSLTDEDLDELKGAWIWVLVSITRRFQSSATPSLHWSCAILSANGSRMSSRGPLLLPQILACLLLLLMHVPTVQAAAHSLPLLIGRSLAQVGCLSNIILTLK